MWGPPGRAIHCFIFETEITTTPGFPSHGHLSNFNINKSPGSYNSFFREVSVIGFSSLQNRRISRTERSPEKRVQYNFHAHAQNDSNHTRLTDQK